MAGIGGEALGEGLVAVDPGPAGLAVAAEGADEVSAAAVDAGVGLAVVEVGLAAAATEAFWAGAADAVHRVPALPAVEAGARGSSPHKCTATH